MGTVNINKKAGLLDRRYDLQCVASLSLKPFQSGSQHFDIPVMILREAILFGLADSQNVKAFKTHFLSEKFVLLFILNINGRIRSFFNVFLKIITL